MMSLVRAQLEEPTKKDTIRYPSLFGFCGFNNNVIISGAIPTERAKSVAWSPSAASGGYSEDDKAQRSILCERRPVVLEKIKEAAQMNDVAASRK